MPDKRVLVTGGAGFIGSHLCGRLLAAGQTVFCLDNFSTGSWTNIEDYMKNPRFKIIVQDVTKPLELAVDQIYNLACPASPVHYQAAPVKTLKTCLLGAINILELARRSGATVLQASTSEVYGDPLEHPQPESYRGNVNPVGIRSCYDEGKRCAETLVFDYRRQYGLPVKVARIFNTYGPQMLANDGRVVSNFIIQALQGRNLTVYGQGEQTRSFCYVSDLVEGLIRLMAAGDHFTGPVNLGNPEEITIRELAHKVLNLTGSRAAIVFRPLPEDDPRRRNPQISLAETILNWRPVISLDEGLTLTVAYWRSKIKNKGE